MISRLQPEDELILLSAATRARRHEMRGRMLQLAELADWPRLGELLCAQRLLPTLGPRIVELVGATGGGDDFIADVADAVAVGRRQSALLQLVAADLRSTLARADIRSIALKGPLLGEAIYGEPGRRHSSDIDLLVAAEQLPAAVEVVQGLGYLPPTDNVGHDGLPPLHFALIHERGELPPVELHWRIHWYERQFARERLLPGAVSGTPDDARPPPTDELTALLLFYARDGFVGLRLAADLAAWWDAFGAEIRTDGLEHLLERYPALRRAVLVAARVAERVVALPAGQIARGLEDEDARRSIRRRVAARRSIRGRVAARMANPNPHASRAQLYADVGLVDWLLAPPAKIPDVFRRQLLLPREVRLKRTRKDRMGRPPSSFGHGVRVLTRYGFAIGRLMFARHAAPRLGPYRRPARS